MRRNNLAQKPSGRQGDEGPGAVEPGSGGQGGFDHRPRISGTPLEFMVPVLETWGSA